MIKRGIKPIAWLPIEWIELKDLLKAIEVCNLGKGLCHTLDQSFQRQLFLPLLHPGLDALVSAPD